MRVIHKGVRDGELADAYERGGFEPESNIVRVEIELETILLRILKRL